MMDNTLVLEEVRRFRQTGKEKPINELTASPYYCGFVDAEPLKDVQFSMFLCNNDDGVALRCLWNNTYETMTLALWAVLSRHSDAIFDIGAHTGIYSLTASKANPEALVASFEPYHLNFARLLVNLRANNLPCEAVFPIAMSNEVGSVTFSVTTNSWYLSSGGSVGHQDNATVQKVPAATLDFLREQNDRRFDLVKIDAEGHEPEIFAGAEHVLATDGPDMIVECVFGDNSEVLKQHGYDFYAIDDELLTVEPVETLAPMEGACRNRLVTKRRPTEIEAFCETARQGID